jgi:TRAP-type mannitol/chloroaromatic compound transport system permease small subunit
VTYVKTIDSFVARLWTWIRWAGVAIICILAYAVVKRHFLGTPTIVGYELAIFLMTAAFMLAGGPLLLQEEHVRMDAFYSRWSPRRQAIMDVATFALFIYIIVMIMTSISLGISSYFEGQHTKSIWGPPLWPLKVAIGAGCTILFLQAIANLIRNIATIRGKPLS